MWHVTLKVKHLAFQVHFIVAACENMISGTGMRPGDIVTASNGKTIEVNMLIFYMNKYLNIHRHIISIYRVSQCSFLFVLKKNALMIFLICKTNL